MTDFTSPVGTDETKSHEAAKYRTRLREVEQNNERILAQLATAQAALIEQQALARPCPQLPWRTVGKPNFPRTAQLLRMCKYRVVPQKNRFLPAASVLILGHWYQFGAWPTRTRRRKQ